MMRRPEITEADRQLAKKIKAQVFRNPGAVILTHGLLGHAESSHVDVSSEKLLDNMLFRGRKSGDTAFYDRKTAQDCLAETIATKSFTIAKFVNRAKRGETMVLYMPFFDDETGDTKSIGYGFIGRRSPSGIGTDISKPIQAITSNMTATVIKKDPRIEDGWSIVTSFPVSRFEPHMDEYEKSDLDISPNPGFDFEAALHATESYKSATPVQRVLLDYNNIARKNCPDMLPVQYVPRDQGDGCEKIIIRHPAARFKDEYYTISGDDFAEAVASGEFPVPERLRVTVEYLTDQVNAQIKQIGREWSEKARAKSGSKVRDVEHLDAGISYSDCTGVSLSM